jgi:hypothetical protein
VYTSVLPTHSSLRWIIVVLALAIVVKFALGWLRGSEFKSIDRSLILVLIGLLDLQAALGLTLLVGLGLSGEGFPAIRFAHGGVIFLALVLAHLPAFWKHTADHIRFRNTLFCLAGALLLIYVAVSLLPIGWSL